MNNYNGLSIDFNELNKTPLNLPILDETRTTAKGNKVRVTVTHYAKEYGSNGDYKIAYQVELRNRHDGEPIRDIKGNPCPYITGGSTYAATETEARETANWILSEHNLATLSENESEETIQ